MGRRKQKGLLYSYYFLRNSSFKEYGGLVIIISNSKSGVFLRKSKLSFFKPV